MSKAEVKKPTWVTKCDFCKKEINDRNNDDWAHIIRKYQNRPTDEAPVLRFFWPKKRTYESIQYDFHAACFDKMVKKYVTKEQL